MNETNVPLLAFFEALASKENTASDSGIIDRRRTSKSIYVLVHCRRLEQNNQCIILKTNIFRASFMLSMRMIIFRDWPFDVSQRRFFNFIACHKPSMRP